MSVDLPTALLAEAGRAAEGTRSDLRLKSFPIGER